MNARTNNRWLYALLGIVFVLAMGYQIWFSITAIQYRRHYDIEAGWPCGLNFDSDRFSYTAPSLKEFGVLAGVMLAEFYYWRSYYLSLLSRFLAVSRPRL